MQNTIPFVRSYALSMQAIHGGKMSPHRALCKTGLRASMNTEAHVGIAP